MNWYFKTTLTAIIFIASLSLCGAAFFYLWQLDNLQLILSTILAVALTWLLARRLKIDSLPGRQTNITNKQQKRNIFALTKSLLIILYSLTALKTILIISTYQTFEAIRSPWEVVPSYFLIIYFALTVLLLVILLQRDVSQGSNATGQLFLISIHFFLSYSIAFFVYGINFGFDPFIHQAGEKILAATGTISPKPLLYIGQYSLVVWLSKISSLNIILVDKLLVPVLSALLLPPIIYYALTKGFNLKSRPSLSTVLTFPIFLLPFYFTVPQNMANLFLLLTVLLAVVFFRIGPPDVPHRPALLWLLGLTTLAIHPFSGIPLIIYLTIVTFLKQQKKILTRNHKLIASTIIIILAIAALPTALSLGGELSNNVNVTPSSETVSDLGLLSVRPAGLISDFLPPVNWVPFYSIFHLVYLFKFNHIIILALLAAGGLWLLWKSKRILFASGLILTFLIISIDVSLINLLNLPIIAYELPEFIARFWQIGLLFLTPIILYTIGKLIKLFLGEGSAAGSIGDKSLMKYDNERLTALSGSASRSKMLLRESSRAIYPTAAIFFLALIATIGLYLIYPRHDAFAKSRAFATSQYDIQVVNWIEQDAQGKDYVVLANQAVSAAALQEFGFAKYYSTPNSLTPKTANLFYYPVPTTSPLYQLYLNMVYEMPTTESLQQVLDLTGADIAYFVINDYWLDFEKIVEQAQQNIGPPHIITNNKLVVFKLSK
jgi:hypothetical protein